MIHGQPLLAPDHGTRVPEPIQGGLWTRTRNLLLQNIPIHCCTITWSAQMCLCPFHGDCAKVTVIACHLRSLPGPLHRPQDQRRHLVTPVPTHVHGLGGGYLFAFSSLPFSRPNLSKCFKCFHIWYFVMNSLEKVRDL